MLVKCLLSKLPPVIKSRSLTPLQSLTELEVTFFFSRAVKKCVCMCVRLRLSVSLSVFLPQLPNVTLFLCVRIVWILSSKISVNRGVFRDTATIANQVLTERLVIARKFREEPHAGKQQKNSVVILDPGDTKSMPEAPDVRQWNVCVIWIGFMSPRLFGHSK